MQQSGFRVSEANENLTLEQEAVNGKKEWYFWKKYIVRLKGMSNTKSMVLGMGKGVCGNVLTTRSLRSATW